MTCDDFKEFLGNKEIPATNAVISAARKHTHECDACNLWALETRDRLTVELPVVVVSRCYSEAQSRFVEYAQAAMDDEELQG